MKSEGGVFEKRKRKDRSDVSFVSAHIWNRPNVRGVEIDLLPVNVSGENASANKKKEDITNSQSCNDVVYSLLFSKYVYMHIRYIQSGIPLTPARSIPPFSSQPRPFHYSGMYIHTYLCLLTLPIAPRSPKPPCYLIFTQPIPVPSQPIQGRRCLPLPLRALR